MSTNKSIGSLGEQYACTYLQSLGFHIIERNPTSRWGELDIVAEKQNIIHFVEVKTRVSLRHGNPYEAVHGIKLRHLNRTIQYYILSHALQHRKLQFDVVSVELNADHSLKSCKLYENVSFS